MKLLLDTHVVLWWQRDDRRLNKAAREAIATADIVWVSAVSGWEVAIKTALGRLRLDEPFHVLLKADDFTELPLTLAHGEHARGSRAASHRPVRSGARGAGAGRRRHRRDPRSRVCALWRAGDLDLSAPMPMHPCSWTLLAPSSSARAPCCSTRRSRRRPGRASPKRRQRPSPRRRPPTGSG